MSCYDVYDMLHAMDGRSPDCLSVSFRYTKDQIVLGIPLGSPKTRYVPTGSQIARVQECASSGVKVEESWQATEKDRGMPYRDSVLLPRLSLGRYEAVGCLRKTVGVIGGKDLPAEPSEEEFRLGDESSPCDSVIIPDGAPLSAYQYFENTHTTDTRKPAFRWLGVRGKVKNEPTLLPESKKRAFGTQFGPFALVTVAKVGVLDNNNVRQTHDWESLSSTFCLQYHNQGKSPN
ncbi:kinesin-4-like isoform X1 [Cucumis melo var. makuwa]|uniref:Kinesin-4-like isoform X1 n=1 Tax=Cucumis melo var. makuwa TaxID=1194695 RepID=A0A5A7VCW7_CUCMM|nr:kinesin-4-like isoform X1 [Cucumis melo var. makuwa]TYK18596.1 kinesin-4-like isoform X1 [Cucumis melo var. makuwa]